MSWDGRKYGERIRIENRRRCSLQNREGRGSERNRQRGEESGMPTRESAQVRSEMECKKKTYGNLTIHGIENLGSTDLAVAVVRPTLGDSFAAIRTLNRFCRMKYGFDSVTNNVSARTQHNGKRKLWTYRSDYSTTMYHRSGRRFRRIRATN